MESKIVQNDFKKLNAFVAALGGGYGVNVGILGKKANRNDPKAKGQTNADIGAIHEFGRPATRSGPAIPQRSFLLMPLRMKTARILKEMKEIQMVKKLGKGDILAIMTDLGIICERVILDAFNSRGYGQWPANAPYTVKKKGSSQPLIDLGFLRRSITSEVVQR